MVTRRSAQRSVDDCYWQKAHSNDRPYFPPNRSCQSRQMADDPQPKPEYEPPKGAEAKGAWNGSLDYTATAKFYVLRKKEKPSAELFSVSYVADGGDSSR